MRNASGHKGENELQQKKMNTGTHIFNSIKHVTRKFLEVSRFSCA